MADYRIIFNQASNLIHLDLPDDMVPVTSGKITATNTGGSATDVTAAAVTVASASTISADAEEGANTITATAGAYEPGERWHIADSDDGDEEIVTVEHFDSATKIITTREDLHHDHKSGTALSPAFVTYTLDSTDATYWPNLLEGKLTFDAWNTADGAVWRSFVVTKAHFGIGGLEEYFSLNYSRFFRAITSDQLDDLAEDSIDDVAAILGPYGHKLRAVVTEASVRRIICDTIAMQIAAVNGWQDEYKMMKQNRDDRLNRLRENQNWYDSDEDNVQEAGENELQTAPLPSRYW